MPGWSPIARPGSSLAERARVALENITEELLQSRERPLETSLFFAYKSRSAGNRRWMEVAAERLNIAIQGAESLWLTRRFGLLGGLAGLGFGIEQVLSCLNLKNADINRATDAALLLELQRGRWQGDPYHATGLAGIGVYFLERLPLPSATQGLELVIGHIEDQRRRANWVGSGDVACGLWGIAHFLTRAIDRGIGVVSARSLLESMDRSLSQAVTNAESVSCGGALGVAAVCFQTGRPELGRTLVDQSLLTRPSVKDACAAEAAHTWNRVRSLYPDTDCHPAALESLDRLLTVCERPNTVGARKRENFFGGAAMTGLVLMASITHTEPEWDRIMCLSGT